MAKVSTRGKRDRVTDSPSAFTPRLHLNQIEYQSRPQKCCSPGNFSWSCILYAEGAESLGCLIASFLTYVFQVFQLRILSFFDLPLCNVPSLLWFKVNHLIIRKLLMSRVTFWSIWEITVMALSRSLLHLFLRLCVINAFNFDCVITLSRGV